MSVLLFNNLNVKNVMQDFYFYLYSNNISTLWYWYFYWVKDLTTSSTKVSWHVVHLCYVSSSPNTALSKQFVKPVMTFYFLHISYLITELFTNAFYSLFLNLTICSAGCSIFFQSCLCLDLNIKTVYHLIHYTFVK